MIYSYIRGNKIQYKHGQWQYMDGVPIYKEERHCTRCGKPPNKDGSDACLGKIDGVSHACCGHGVEEPYKIMS